MAKSPNGPVELANVRVTLGQFFTLLGACGVIIAMFSLNAYRLSEVEKKVNFLVAQAPYTKAEALLKIAEADSIHNNHTQRLARIELRLKRNN